MGKHKDATRFYLEPLYGVWWGMLGRCHDPKNKGYSRYGGNGIFVCKEWRESYISFRDWALSNGWQRGLSIDRFPDNLGGYEPSNCRIATAKQQGNNRRTNMILELNGLKKTLAEWCSEYNQPQKRVHNRLRDGWGLLKALTTKEKQKDGYKKRKRNKTGQFI